MAYIGLTGDEFLVDGGWMAVAMREVCLWRDSEKDEGIGKSKTTILAAAQPTRDTCSGDRIPSSHQTPFRFSLITSSATATRGKVSPAGCDISRQEVRHKDTTSLHR